MGGAPESLPMVVTLGIRERTPVLCRHHGQGKRRMAKVGAVTWKMGSWRWVVGSRQRPEPQRRSHLEEAGSRTQEGGIGAPGGSGRRGVSKVACCLP